MAGECSLVNVLKALVLAYLLVYVLSTYPITAMTEVSGFSVISIFCMFIFSQRCGKNVKPRCSSLGK
jgi:hypothetical protein